MSSLFQQAPNVGGGGVYQFGQSVTLHCGVSGTASFTWGAPSGSTSLQRGTITNYIGFTTLTFQAREEDTGIFICIGVGPPGAATVIVGNASLFHPVHYQDQCSIPLIQFQLL